MFFIWYKMKLNNLNTFDINVLSQIPGTGSVIKKILVQKSLGGFKACLLKLHEIIFQFKINFLKLLFVIYFLLTVSTRLHDNSK